MSEILCIFAVLYLVSVLKAESVLLEHGADISWKWRAPMALFWPITLIGVFVVGMAYSRGSTKNTLGDK